MSQVDTNQNDQLLETLNNELHNCQSQCNQAHLFLTEICNRLHSTKELINQYQISAQIKEERIAKLEQELKLKSEKLEVVNFEHEELRRRIKSEKHNASQYKAALHRCLDTSHLPEEEAKQIHDQARTLTHSDLSSQKISEPAVASSSPYQSHHSINLAPPEVISPQFIQDIQDRDIHGIQNGIQNIDAQNTIHHPSLIKSPKKSQNSESKISQIVREISEQKPKTFSGIKLPQFAPLKPR